jgi:hypothetical protein
MWDQRGELQSKRSSVLKRGYGNRIVMVPWVMQGGIAMRAMKHALKGNKFVLRSR